MPKRKISMNLSVSSLNSAIKQLEEYKSSLKKKNDLFVKRLAELGIPIIDQRMNAANFTIDSKGIQSGANTNHNTFVKVNSFGDVSRAVLTVEGQDLLFVEFGAGVYHNTAAGTSPHPKGGELGYKIGYYGKGHGKQKVWGYYDDAGQLILTHGVEAQMPAYSAWKEMFENAVRIAKEVFGK